MRPPQNQKVKGERTKGKLIRLDDLIPEKGVKGGRQMPFGVTETTRTTNNRSKS
jgi:hypothetical protein